MYHLSGSISDKVKTDRAPILQPFPDFRMGPDRLLKEDIQNRHYRLPG